MMKENKRADGVLRELRSKGNVSLDELVKYLHSPPASIRRDLAKLEMKGLIRRTTGGATLVEPGVSRLRDSVAHHLYSLY